MAVPWGPPGLAHASNGRLGRAKQVAENERETMMQARGMLVAVAAISCAYLGGCANKESALIMGQERVIFTGLVEMVEPLGQREATVFPVGVDPQFLLVVKVDSIEQNSSSPVAVNKSISFAIHSPSRLLGTESATGKRFKFRATWTFGPEPKRFSWIEARPAPQ